MAGVAMLGIPWATASKLAYLRYPFALAELVVAMPSRSRLSHS